MAKRITEPDADDLEMYEHVVTCPHCKAELTVVSPMEKILMARRTCPACKKEFVIQDGEACKQQTEAVILIIPVNTTTELQPHKIGRLIERNIIASFSYYPETESRTGAIEGSYKLDVC
jgi:transposase-like protein